MADAVTNRVILNSNTRYIAHLTNISDGSGESAVIKVDKSTLLADDGAEPASLEIEAVRWSIQGFTSVRLLWDHATDDLGMVLSGSGYEDYNSAPTNTDKDHVGGLADPRSSGGAGDLLLTTNGGSSGASYDITIWLMKSSD